MLGIASVAIFQVLPGPTKNGFISNPPSPTPLPQDPAYTGWYEFYSSELGLRFYYPPEFKNSGQGQITSVIRLANKGGEICINLTGCLTTQTSPFEIRATSFKWANPKSSSFTDLQGFRRDQDSYFLRLPGGQEIIMPADGLEELPTAAGVSALLIPGRAGDLVNVAYPPPGFVGAVINTHYPDFPGAAVHMQLTNQLTIQVFRHILASFTFPYAQNFPPDSLIQSETVPPRYTDATIKESIAKIAESLNCRYLLSGSYPASYYPDTACSGTLIISNPVIQKPYYYSPINSGQGFILKAKLSTGEIYTATETDFPRPTIVP